MIFIIVLIYFGIFSDYYIINYCNERTRENTIIRHLEPHSKLSFYAVEMDNCRGPYRGLVNANLFSVRSSCMLGTGPKVDKQVVK